MQQQTIKKNTEITGVGLHSGQTITLNVKPAPENTGIIFSRVDLPNKPQVRASMENLHHRMRCTALVSEGAEVHTTEHLLAACFALKIDNLFVEINGAEVPGMDGSALPFYKALKECGIETQNEPAKIINISSKLEVSEGKAFIETASAENLKLEYTLDYDVPFIEKKTVIFEIDEETFAKEIAPARTFALRAEADALLKMGLGKGANVKNTLIIDNDGNVIENELRFPDEFARHKLLDLLGDVALVGSRLTGHIKAHRSGHPLNAQIVKKILSQ